MLSVRMEHTVWRKITYDSLRGLLSNPLFQNTQGKIFIFHFIFSSKFEHISDMYPNAPTHSNLPMYILSGFISQNKLCESQGEVNEVYGPGLVYGPVAKHCNHIVTPLQSNIVTSIHYSPCKDKDVYEPD